MPTVPAQKYYCPFCGAPQVTSERRPNGYSWCEKSHKYKTSLALTELPALKSVKHYPTPTLPGWYWAKWKQAEEGSKTWTTDNPVSKNWEPVEVFVDDPETLLVYVFGEEVSQSVENFFWGPQVTGKPK